MLSLRTKKIIAREFIAITVVMIIGLASILLTYPYDSFRRYQIDQINKEVVIKTKVADSLSFSYNHKLQQQLYFFNEFNREYDLGTYDTSEKWWERNRRLTINDSIILRWNGEWRELNDTTGVIDFLTSLGFPDGQHLQSFILKNSFEIIDHENMEKAELLRMEIGTLQYKSQLIDAEIFTFNERVLLGLRVIAFAAAIIFLFRYMYYAISWSLRILKEKGD